MRYFLGDIMERNGEYEYNTHFILATGDNEDLDQACKDVAINWRGGEEDDFDDYFGGCWSDGSLIFPFKVDKELSEDELAEARKYLNVLVSGE